MSLENISMTTGWTDKCMDGGTNGHMNGWKTMDGWTNEMYGRTNY